MAPLSAEKHIQGAGRNLTFADGLKQSKASDPCTIQWAITALFYAAVHAVRAYLVAKYGINVSAHSDMPGIIRSHQELKTTSRDYDLLKQESHAARYYLKDDFTWADYDKLRGIFLRISNAWIGPTKAALGQKSGS